MKNVSFVVGLAVALIGLANVMPTYDVLPRIGPFELAAFRPGFYFLCVLAGVMALLIKRRGRGECVSAAIVIVIAAYTAWDSYRIGQIMVDSIFFFGPREFWITVAALGVSIYLGWRIWGPPIALLGIVSALYLITGPYWPGLLETAPSDINETVSANLWYSIDQGILGRILGIVATTVLPFIVLGALLEGVGAGSSMIRIAFHFMRRFRGGPAYAAVVSSALFGSVSGSAVANVVGTGVVTIPMIRKRGFSNEFSGAVEAAASTGGQILPPIMGAAALVMADIVGVSYVTVMKAAILPALAYYASLFLTIGFEAAKLDVGSMEDDESDPPAMQDWLNLILVFAPLATIVFLLLRGMSPSGASISAILLLFPLSFINPEVRRAPWKLLTALSNGGLTVARLIMAIAIVGIVVAVMSATGLPSKMSILLMDAASSSLIAALIISALGCIILGMGMPTLPAYIAIIAVMGPTLQSMGLELLTAHFFVFIFGVASVITPPVAIAAYAAAAIAEGKPISTAVQSSRVGAMIFLIPFAFVLNPELQLGAGGGDIRAADVGLILVFLGAAMWMVASALIGFDGRRLTHIERVFRFLIGIALISGESTWQFAALGVVLILVGLRFIGGKRQIAK